MGRHNSRRDSSDSAGPSKKRKNSRSSSIEARQQGRIEQLEKMVQELQCTRPSGQRPNVQAGDEKMIPVFDPAQDDLTGGTMGGTRRQAGSTI